MGGLKQDYWQNYVDGNWVDGGAGRLTVENPGTGEPLAEIALADAAEYRPRGEGGARLS